MTRLTFAQIDPNALLHNLNRIESFAPAKKIIAMVKANAYGCGLAAVIPVLDGRVAGFGVACLEEALAIRMLGGRGECILFEGVFNPEEYTSVAENQFQCVIHQREQLQWLLANPLPQKIKIWLKVDTGMHRLGFLPEEVYDVMNALTQCPWVDNDLVLVTHFACADEPDNEQNKVQLNCFRALNLPVTRVTKSLANSAAIIALPESHADIVRPGIMLYGVSPFSEKTGEQLGLKPVMRFKSMINAIHKYPAGARIGYGGTWQTDKPSIIGVVAVGYGDGYPRHIAANTPVAIHGERIPIIGRVSMDMITINLTDYQKKISIGDEVELWGESIPIELIATSAGTIAYELMCQLSSRVYRR